MIFWIKTKVIRSGIRLEGPTSSRTTKLCIISFNSISIEHSLKLNHILDSIDFIYICGTDVIPNNIRLEGPTSSLTTKLCITSFNFISIEHTLKLNHTFIFSRLYMCTIDVIPKNIRLEGPIIKKQNSLLT